MRAVFVFVFSGPVSAIRVQALLRLHQRLPSAGLKKMRMKKTPNIDCLAAETMNFKESLCKL